MFLYSTHAKESRRDALKTNEFAKVEMHWLQFKVYEPMSLRQGLKFNGLTSRFLAEGLSYWPSWIVPVHQWMDFVDIFPSLPL